jgi:hypothetical protein
MIIAESDKHYRMITQNDHRDLAGSSPPTGVTSNLPV